MKPEHKEIFDRIEDVRWGNRLSQAEFGRRCGVSKAVYNMYFRGVSNLGINIIIGLAKNFDVDMNYILTGTKVEGETK